MARANRQARDNFPKPVREHIGRRVGYLCSHCYISTLGPTTDPNDSSNTGVAAHITAAAEGGPRYDSSLTPDARSAAPNGIWCCAICAKLIDDDTLRFTTPKLRAMRDAAERAADIRRDVANQRVAQFATAEALTRLAATAILGQWQTTYHYVPHELVELDLREDRETIWTIASLLGGLQQRRAFVVRGRPGAGKTMTLLQVAVAANPASPVPLILSVSAWAASGRDLIGYVESILTVHGVERASVPDLFRMGRLALLLNGWNETAEADLVRADQLLREFATNFPGTPLLVTTRMSESRPSLLNETLIEVHSLSRPKKIQAIHAAGLTDPNAFIAHVVGNAGLDQITDTPLFLAAALRLARAGITLPETRSGLLLRCIEDIEQRPDHRAALRAAPCQGFHRHYLVAIAAAMIRRGRTTFSATEIQAAIAECSRELRAAGAFPSPAASSAVADNLVHHHLLVLSPSGDGSHSFVHQQFQERFAADWLLSRIRELSAANSPAAILSFQQDILNYPQWSEALTFAVEDLAESGEAKVAAALVQWMMSVDLVAAAELAGVGGPALWAEVGRGLSEALRHWHARGHGPHQDCALAGMVATGSADFADSIWSMLEGADEQDFFRALRAYPVFRVACLGPGWQDRMVRLSERRQEIFLGEISRQSGQEEIEFARRLAVSDAPARIKNSAIELLAYRRQAAETVALAQTTAFGSWTMDTYRLFDDLPRALVAPLVPRLVDEFGRERSSVVRHAILSLLHAQNHEGWPDLAKRRWLLSRKRAGKFCRYRTLEPLQQISGFHSAQSSLPTAR